MIFNHGVYLFLMDPIKVNTNVMLHNIACYTNIKSLTCILSTIDLGHYHGIMVSLLFFAALI